jgi:hypothetical protein
MDNELLVYMDCCCLNRPADDQTQDKIRIETDAIIGILDLFANPVGCRPSPCKLLGVLRF